MNRKGFLLGSGAEYEIIKDYLILILEEINLLHKYYKPLEYKESQNNQNYTIIEYQLIMKNKGEEWILSDISKNLTNSIKDKIEDFHKNLKQNLDNDYDANNLNHIAEIIMEFSIVKLDDIVKGITTGFLFELKEEKIKDKSYILDYREKTIEEIFGLKYLVFELQLLYYDEGIKKDIHQMSLGQKTEAVLRLFLEAGDKADHPILIDQPESNLENKVMCEVVSKLIKNASKRRQVFIATHNPNIAILSNADQIIKVELDKENQRNKFNYECMGGIESKLIFEDYVKILESGLKESFKKRDDIYDCLI